MSGLVSDISFTVVLIWSRYAAQSSIMLRLLWRCPAEPSAGANVIPSREVSGALDPAGVAAAAREVDVDVIGLGAVKQPRQQRLDSGAFNHIGVDHHAVLVIGAHRQLAPKQNLRELA